MPLVHFFNHKTTHLSEFASSLIEVVFESIQLSLLNVAYSLDVSQRRSKLKMRLRVWLLIAFIHNSLASSPITLGDAIPSTSVAPAQGAPGVSVTRTTTLMKTTSVLESSAPTSKTTAPPLTYNRFGFRRQECFNDQGFRVNCATWTGYYYTWGPPGNPYEGGPGEGGGAGGENNGYTTFIVGGSSGASRVLPSLMLWSTSLWITLAAAVIWS